MRLKMNQTTAARPDGRTEAAEEPGGHGDQYPEQKDLKEVSAEDKSEHGKDQQLQAGEELGEAFIVAQEADGERADEGRDRREGVEHRDSEAVDVEVQISEAAAV